MWFAGGGNRKTKPIKTWQTKKGSRITKVVEKRSNSYLITTKDFHVLVDIGKISTYSKLMKNLEVLCDSNTPLKHLFFTHSHYDHCQNTARLKDKYDCKIWVSEQEEIYIKMGLLLYQKVLPYSPIVFHYWDRNYPKNYLATKDSLLMF